MRAGEREREVRGEEREGEEDRKRRRGKEEVKFIGGAHLRGHPGESPHQGELGGVRMKS